MLQAQLLFAVLFASTAAGLMPIAAAQRRWSWPLVTLAMAAAVAAGFAAQLALPELVGRFERDPPLWHGEIWRAVTSLFLQGDGGAIGAAFNLTILLWIGSVAEQRFSAGKWLAIYLIGGVATEFLAFAWQPHGAGNSIACLALAGAMTMHAGARARGPVGLLICLLSLAAGAGLLVLSDIHGIGFWSGVVIELGFLTFARAAPQSEPAT